MNGTKPEEIYKAICSQTVELIFTAHPTQVPNPTSHARLDGLLPGRVLWSCKRQHHTPCVGMQCPSV